MKPLHGLTEYSLYFGSFSEFATGKGLGERIRPGSVVGIAKPEQDSLQEMGGEVRTANRGWNNLPHGSDSWTGFVLPQASRKYNGK